MYGDTSSISPSLPPLSPSEEADIKAELIAVSQSRHNSFLTPNLPLSSPQLPSVVAVFIPFPPWLHPLKPLHMFQFISLLISLLILSILVHFDVDFKITLCILGMKNPYHSKYGDAAVDVFQLIKAHQEKAARLPPIEEVKTILDYSIRSVLSTQSLCDTALIYMDVPEELKEQACCPSVFWKEYCIYNINPQDSTSDQFATHENVVD
ncbi:hypothetical protein L2E82_40633 [Cichorium intybus]|uniref:Uncharacterized protein n=1 Tax=Cichorium intybus TaxID=13427 RepID=A0ACB9ALC4_CICIN|nr:hypothetical protein L2E82_40633 [Cichorium intybus]